MSVRHVIDDLLESFDEIRYVAIYHEEKLFSRQRIETTDSSSSETDTYEELLVNPVLLTAARQRGNIDCGGLKFIIVGYGNFYQLIREIKSGHISICLDKNADLSKLPGQILGFLNTKYPHLS